MNEVPRMNVIDALREAGEGAVLLDVRESDEWAAGHAPEAVHVRLAELGTAPLPPWRDRRVLAICRSGNRSKTAAALLVARGYDAYSVDGGMAGWRAAGGRVVTSAGHPGAVA